MCNRIVQRGREVRPGEPLAVWLKGPGGFFPLEMDGVFAGTARQESRGYWTKREGGVDVVVPEVSRFREANESTGEQTWEDLPDGFALEGLLLPEKTGKDGGVYRLLKIVTREATEDELTRLGNNRVPVVVEQMASPRGGRGEG